MPLINIAKPAKIVCSIVLISAVAIGYWLSVYNSFGYQSGNKSTGATILLSSIVLLPMFWFRVDLKSMKGKMLYIFPMVVLCVFTVIYLGILKKRYEHAEININGMGTTAKVIGFEEEHSRRNVTKFATIQYQVGKSYVLQRVVNDNDQYHQNELIDIKYAVAYPEMIEVMAKHH